MLFYGFPNEHVRLMDVLRELTLIISKHRNHKVETLDLAKGTNTKIGAFYEGISTMESQTGKLIGSPVSPGLVEGKVRVVVDPLKSGLLPGEILVCRGTDPAWTPLFLTAGGLIMEVGGMMTHGAIVAREYGIPAVVGVDHAIEILYDGQQIQLNGSNGEIILIDN